MDDPRSYWTVATRDLRNVIGVELQSREDASIYRDSSKLRDWVVVRVSKSGHRRHYTSPELKDGLAWRPVAGLFHR